MGGPVKGQADHLLLGDWNAACSMCGRKRKASQLVKNWQGQYRCPEHNEPRQPQDFARGIKENMGVPWAQDEQIFFVTFNLTFPAVINPNPIVLALNQTDLVTEGVPFLLTTESGQILVTEPGVYLGTALVLLPSYIVPTSYLWSWQTGGVGINIATPNANITQLSTTNPAATGVLQCLITSSLGGQAIPTCNVVA